MKCTIKNSMPLSVIRVKEFQCAKCGYKWINRFNGKEGSLPKRCAKCKTHGWNDETGNITPEENGLRRRIMGYGELYYQAASFSPTSSDEGILGGQYKRKNAPIHWDNELTKKFIALKPRPTIEELRRVVYPLVLKIGLTSQNLYKVSKRAQFDKEYLRILKSEAQKRQAIMEQIISEDDPAILLLRKKR
jgi:hypothetical protein